MSRFHLENGLIKNWFIPNFVSKIILLETVNFYLVIEQFGKHSHCLKYDETSNRRRHFPSACQYIKYISPTLSMLSVHICSNQSVPVYKIFAVFSRYLSPIFRRITRITVKEQYQEQLFWEVLDNSFNYFNGGQKKRRDHNNKGGADLTDFSHFSHNFSIQKVTEVEI